MMPSQLYPEGGYEVNQVWLWLKNPYSKVSVSDAAIVYEYYRYVSTTWTYIEQDYELFEGCVLAHSTFDMAEAQCNGLREGFRQYMASHWYTMRDLWRRNMP